MKHWKCFLDYKLHYTFGIYSSPRHYLLLGVTDRAPRPPLEICQFDWRYQKPICPTLATIEWQVGWKLIGSKSLQVYTRHPLSPWSDYRWRSNTRGVNSISTYTSSRALWLSRLFCFSTSMVSRPRAGIYQLLICDIYWTLDLVYCSILHTLWYYLPHYIRHQSPFSLTFFQRFVLGWFGWLRMFWDSVVSDILPTTLKCSSLGHSPDIEVSPGLQIELVLSCRYGWFLVNLDDLKQ